MRPWIHTGLLGLVALVLGCSAEVPDEPEDEALASSALAGGPSVQVVQFNPYYGGMYPKWAYTQPGGGHDLPKTYETMETFSKLLAASYPNAAIIGMEEVEAASVAEEIRTRLGPTWATIWYGGEKETGSAIFYRTTDIALQKNLGKHAVNHFDAKHGGNAVMFGGALFTQVASGAELAFFTGKMTPRTYDGHNDQEKDDEAKSLTTWVNTVTADHPHTTKILTIDQNDPYAGLAMTELNKSWRQPGDETPTWKSPNSGKWFRYDYVWTNKTGAFVGPSHVMGDSGSDHRSVISTVALKK